MERKRAGAEGFHRVKPHTADVLLEAGGGTLPLLFRHAAAGLCGIIGFPGRRGARRRIEVALREQDLPLLLARWLNEIIYLVSTGKIIPRGFSVTGISENAEGAELAAVITGVLPRAGAPGPEREVKAASLHGLKLERGKGLFSARVLLDL